MKNYDLRKALETNDLRDTITCRALAYQAIFKTILSEEDTTRLMNWVSSKTGKKFMDVYRGAADGNALISEWMGRRVKMAHFEGDRRLHVFHD